LLATLADDPRPAVAFDSPYRVKKSLAIIAEVMPDRPLTVARELTKLHEQILRGTASQVIEALGDPPRGEFTLVISGRDRPLGPELAAGADRRRSGGLGEGRGGLRRRATSMRNDDRPGPITHG
jgi:16S rRNA (cytidine1402-2'-O)-methyltransferase